MKTVAEDSENRKIPARPVRNLNDIGLNIPNGFLKHLNTRDPDELRDILAANPSVSFGPGLNSPTLNPNQLSKDTAHFKMSSALEISATLGGLSTKNVPAVTDPLETQEHIEDQATWSRMPIRLRLLIIFGACFVVFLVIVLIFELRQ
eukprot:TRINITY_DN5932_c0_g3_i4.p1 TRINITY_DN5932_c0_g3~~TRINITY_DN5932_c0_g3_i4.p1  ORF type:complete len:148 (+),score=8.60 TRINITY_DN5932_c0_g3_i4:653-1096(+)